eukprot:COSAG01_NODE_31129_length_603_cov_1.009921_1_plen_128_part_10
MLPSSACPPRHSRSCRCDLLDRCRSKHSALPNSSSIRTVNIHPLNLLIQDTSFRDNRGLVGADFFFSWYPDLKNKTGLDNTTIIRTTFEMTRQCGDLDQSNPFVGPTWFCDGTSLAPAGLFSFAGGTS